MIENLLIAPTFLLKAFTFRIFPVFITYQYALIDNKTISNLSKIDTHLKI